jgi:hypothetical protein
MENTNEPLKSLLPLTYKLEKILTMPLVIGIIIPMLLYHLWVYVYLGYLSGGTYFYTGCLYAFNYAGTCVAYWIVCRQNQSSYINDMTNIIWNDKTWNNIDGSNYQLLDYNLNILKLYNKAYSSFKRYCLCWERLLKILLFLWWGATLINLIVNILHDTGIFYSYETFDDKPLGLWGYYNLSGQIIAALSILTASVLMMTGLYQLKCITKGFAYKLRGYRNKILTPEESNLLIHNLRKDYLTIQGSYLAYSGLWEFPILVSLTFCTQVAVASVFAIHYSIQDCILHNECEFVIVFPFVWFFAAFIIMGIIFKSIANVNEVTQLIKDVFIYAEGNIETANTDYKSIGGRSNWLEYLESNPLKLSICGTIITTKLVVNTGYTNGI